MDYRTQILTLAARYCASRQIAESTLATRLANHGAFFERIRQGASLTVDRWIHAIQWFRRNWPDGAVWPEGVGVIVLDDPAPDAAAPPSTCKPGLHVAGPVSASGPPDPTVEQTSIVAGSAAA